ncbi:hypothetical protein TIFTF001_050059 [Ficus carica]|uniref:Uncharacterized protein n=1 Tax=Ficus carica TaxID=3494 RepID=A0AA87Z9R2_FICCA|nr:hypothetical protein TIFTF001_050059 [Ficus carica]
MPSGPVVSKQPRHGGALLATVVWDFGERNLKYYELSYEVEKLVLYLSRMIARLNLKQ